MIDHCIEKLLYYAQAHLLLDDLDVIYARNLIMEELKLTDYTAYEVEAEEIESMESPEELLEPIVAYALNEKIVTPATKDALCARIMDIVSLRPSQLADMFNGVYAKNPQKAFSWFNDYCVKNGSVKIGKNAHWEAKNTKGKIEITVAKNAVKPAGGAYPLCAFCQENEGYLQTRNERTLPLDTESCSRFYRCSASPHLYEQGEVVSTRHAPEPFDSGTLLEMTRILDKMPQYFVCMDAESSEHGRFITAGKTAPLFKAPVLHKLKSAEHPYIEAFVPEWYNNVLCAAFTNPANTAEFCNKVIAAFLSQDEANRVAVALKKIDQKYCFTIVFLNKNKKVSAKSKDLVGKDLGVTDYLGSFILPDTVAESFSRIEKYLTGEAKFEAKSENKNLVAVIEKLLKDNPEPLTLLEAQLDIRDEVSAACERALSDVAAFKDEKEFMGFLNSVGFEVKQ